MYASRTIPDRRGSWPRLARRAALGALLALAPRAQAYIVGAVSSYTTNTTGNKSLLLHVATGEVEVVLFAPDVVRVRYHFGTLYAREEVAIAKPAASWASFSSTWTDASATNYLIDTGQLHVEIVKSPKFQVHFRDPTGYDLLRDYQVEWDPDYHPINDASYVPDGSEGTPVSDLPSGFKVKSVKFMPTNESYFGCGEYPAPLNRRGRTLQLWNQDTFSWGEYQNPMYMSLPFFYGVQPAQNGHPVFAYGVFFNNPCRPVFEFWSGLGDTYSFKAGDDQLDYFFFGGGADHTMKKVLDRYSELTGRPAMLPRWALGYHQSRHSYDTQQKVLNVVADCRTNDFPCDAVHLDVDCQDTAYGQKKQLTLNASFTNAAAMSAYCLARGVRLVPLVEPCLTTTDPLWDEANAALHFLKETNGTQYIGHNFLGYISWLDFSSTPTCDWWLGKLTNFTAWTGVEGIWNDLNEPNENNMAVNKIYWCDGRYGTNTFGDTRRWHSNNKNTFNVLECATSYRALRTQQPQKRPFVLSRAGWPGIQRYAAGWSGDNASSYDHLRFDTPLGLSVMISGQPWFGHDIGGFNGDPSAELLTRWLEAGALQTFFRNHTINTSGAQEPWVDGEPYTGWNRRWIKFRYELMPYLYSLARRCATNGLPLNTPTVFHFTSDTNTFVHNDNEFMVGDHLLVAPVYVEGSRHRTLYLPAGTTWYAWPQDQAFTGGVWVTVPVSVGSLPIFVRAGAILPTAPAMKYTGEFQPTNLDLHVWPGGTNSLALYEDDGLTTNYLAGAWAQTVLTEGTRPDGMSVGLGARAGSYNPGARSFTLIAHAAPRTTNVTWNGTALPRYGQRNELPAVAQGWCYDTAAGQVIAKVPDTGAAATLNLAYDVADSDGDGMPDWWELAHGLNPLLNDATGNPDADGRNNLQEFQAGSDPQLADVFASAYTNLSVAANFNYWNEAARNMRLTSNYFWCAVVELSGYASVQFKFVANDSWTNVNWGETNQVSFTLPLAGTAEIAGGDISVTTPTSCVCSFWFNEQTRAYGMALAENTDSDRDGLTDRQEWSNGLAPLQRADGAQDEDGDGMNNREEDIAGTSLVNPSSYFAVASETGGDALPGFTLYWTGVSGRRYTVFYKTNLTADLRWVPVPGLSDLTGVGPLSATDTDTAPARRYYRMGVTAP